MGIASKEISPYYITVLRGVMGLKVTNVKICLCICGDWTRNAFSRVKGMVPLCFVGRG